LLQGFLRFCSVAYTFTNPVEPIMKSVFPLVFVVCVAAHGFANAHQVPMDEASQRMLQARDSAVLVATDARLLKPKTRCATTAKPVPPGKKRKPKSGVKNGRS
jgi:hypothetical protein